MLLIICIFSFFTLTPSDPNTMQKPIQFEEKTSVAQITNNNIKQMADKGSAYIPYGWMLCLCNKGTAEFFVNQNRRKVQRNTIITTMPGQMVSLIDYSDDIDLTVVYSPTQSLLSTSDYSNNPRIAERFMHNIDTPQLYNLMHASDGEVSLGSILEEDDADDLRTIIKILENQSHNKKHVFTPLLTKLVDVIALMIINSTPIAQQNIQSNTKQAAFVKQFFSEVLVNYKEHHDVKFYADKLGISAKYLSTIVREETGSAALQWINKIVLFGAKKMLRSTNKSVAEVAEAMHFSSPSAFIRFFKKQSGTTPLAYKY